MAGYPVDAATINSAAGLKLANLAAMYSEVLAFHRALQDTDRLGGTDGLVAAGMSTTDAGLIVASYIDLSNLWEVGRGRATQPAASDFWYNAKRLLGTNSLPG